MTIYSFDLKSRRIGTIDYPAAVDPFIDCVALLNHVDDTSGLTATSAIGPNLIASGDGILTASAAIFGAAGFRAASTGNAQLQGAGLNTLATGRNITVEGMLRKRVGVGGSGGTLELLGIGSAGNAQYMRLLANNLGTGFALQYVGSAGSGSVSLASIVFADGDERHIVVQYRQDTGAMEVWFNGSRVYSDVKGTTLFAGVTLDEFRPVIWSSPGSVLCYDVDELRVTVCSLPRYTEPTIAVPTAPFPDQ